MSAAVHLLVVTIFSRFIKLVEMHSHINQKTQRGDLLVQDDLPVYLTNLGGLRTTHNLLIC